MLQPVNLMTCSLTLCLTILKMVDETFNPPPLPPGPMNVIDLETGTKGLKQTRSRVVKN